MLPAFRLRFYIDAGQEADAKPGTDEALHQFAALHFHDGLWVDIVHAEDVEEHVALTPLFGQQEGVAGDVFGPGVLHGGEWMAFGDSQDEFVLVDGFDDETLVGYGEGDDAEVDFAAEEGFDGAGFFGAGYLEARPWGSAS